MCARVSSRVCVCVCVCERVSCRVHSMIMHGTRMFHIQSDSHVFKACMSLIDAGGCRPLLPDTAQGCMHGWPNLAIAGATAA
jgi:hypothetical protein